MASQRGEQVAGAAEDGKDTKIPKHSKSDAEAVEHCDTVPIPNDSPDLPRRSHGDESFQHIDDAAKANELGDAIHIQIPTTTQEYRTHDEETLEPNTKSAEAFVQCDDNLQILANTETLQYDNNNTGSISHEDDAADTSEHCDSPSDIEEGEDAYCIGGLHPVYIGDIFAEKYEVLRKIGYGRYSTIWLVKDLTKSSDDDSRFKALKVLSARSYGSRYPIFEREILKHLRDGNQESPGYKYICHLVDDFEHLGPNGTHVCLVFELMGETLQSFGVGFPEDMVPSVIMKRFTYQLIRALQFAHESGVIHTDIKPDNIFVKFRDTSQIESYLSKYPAPEQNRQERYTPIKSEYFKSCYISPEPPTFEDFMELEIALGDWGVASWVENHLTEDIQPIALRSPEVLIKAPWGASTDWWNLGAVIYEVFRAIRLFDGRVPPDGHYEVKEHLAEIVEIFGPFPVDLLEKGDHEIVQFFDSEGRIKDAEPFGRPPLESEAFLPDLDQDERESFGSLLRAMMRINPAERPEAKDLVNQPWVAEWSNSKEL